MTYSLAEIVHAVVADTYEDFETYEADGITWFIRRDNNGDFRTMSVTDSSLIIDTRELEGSPLDDTEAINIHRPSLNTAIGAARNLF